MLKEQTTTSLPNYSKHQAPATIICIITYIYSHNKEKDKNLRKKEEKSTSQKGECLELLRVFKIRKRGQTGDLLFRILMLRKVAKLHEHHKLHDSTFSQLKLEMDSR